MLDQVDRELFPKSDAKSSASLYMMSNQLSKTGFLLCQAKGNTVGSCPQNNVSQLGEDSNKFYNKCSKRV